MKTAGIIAEYNPFHKGHAYQLQYTREVLGADFVIVAMSGDFVQRGTPALLSKHIRTKMALEGGADLILELPVSISCASAEFFASGGINLLDSLGVIDFLSFGSEHDAMPLFLEAAKILTDEPEDFRLELQNALKCGNSFPAARNQALLSYLSAHQNEDSFTLPDNFFASPNNILGIEYCKAIYKQKSAITPTAILRQGAGYHDTTLTNQVFPSASGIRRHLSSSLSTPFLKHTVSSENKDHLPSDSFQNWIPKASLPVFMEALKKYGMISENNLDLLLHYRLLSETYETLITYQDVSPELARRILNCRNQYQGFSQFTLLLKTRELTQTRIQRALLHILLGIRTIPKSIPYARILGFRRSAGSLLKAIKENSRIPVLTKLADAEKSLDSEALSLLEETTFASNLYESLIQNQTNGVFRHEYTKPVVIL